MLDLLPANATAQERALSEAVARLSDVPVLVREQWNADAIPLALLPWMAWAYSVDEWDAGWLEAQKRETVKRALAVQRTKGTIGSVTVALAALGINIRVQEWFNKTPNGDPYTFSVYVETEQTPATEASIVKALSVIEASKNLRSHLENVRVSARSSAEVQICAVAHIGHEIDVTYTAPLLVINEFTLAIAGTVSSGA